MAARLTTLEKPIRRRAVEKDLVVEMGPTGIRIKGYRKRADKWRTFSWEQLAALSDEAEPILRIAEETAGRAELEAMTARQAR